MLSPTAMKADRKRLKGEKTDLVSQMQQLYATLESREEQLRDFIRNYEQHRKVSAEPTPCSQAQRAECETWFVIWQNPTKAPAGLLLGWDRPQQFKVKWRKESQSWGI